MEAASLLAAISIASARGAEEQLSSLPAEARRVLSPHLSAAQALLSSLPHPACRQEEDEGEARAQERRCEEREGGEGRGGEEMEGEDGMGEEGRRRQSLEELRRLLTLFSSLGEDGAIPCARVARERRLQALICKLQAELLSLRLEARKERGRRKERHAVQQAGGSLSLEDGWARERLSAALESNERMLECLSLLTTGYARELRASCYDPAGLIGSLLFSPLLCPRNSPCEATCSFAQRESLLLSSSRRVARVQRCVSSVPQSSVSAETLETVARITEGAVGAEGT